MLLADETEFEDHESMRKVTAGSTLVAHTKANTGYVDTALDPVFFCIFKRLITNYFTYTECLNS